MISVLNLLVSARQRLGVGSWLEFEPRVDDGEDGEDGGGQAARPDKAFPRGVNPQPVQRDEDITTVLQQVQQQRRVAVQHGRHQVEPSAEPRGHDGQGDGGRGDGRGRGGQVVGGPVVAGVSRGRGLGGSVTLLALDEEAELVHVSSQVEDQSEEVIPAGFNTRSNYSSTAEMDMVKV